MEKDAICFIVSFINQSRIIKKQSQEAFCSHKTRKVVELKASLCVLPLLEYNIYFTYRTSGKKLIIDVNMQIGISIGNCLITNTTYRIISIQYLDWIHVITATLSYFTQIIFLFF